MTIQEFLKVSTKQLSEAGIPTARLDVLILIEDTLHCDRAYLLAHGDTTIPSADYTKMNKKIIQRLNHLPLAYIRGKAAFYGRDFVVNKHVLVPRPESEAIIDLLKKCDLPPAPHVADVGTGSGCLGLTAALELRDAKVFLYDIDTSALDIAKQNAAKYKLRNVQFKKQDLLADCQEAFDVILANLPYVPQDYPVNQAARHEPKIALYSGRDGLDHYRQFWVQITALNHKPAYVIVESLPKQHSALTKLAARAGYELETVDGYVLSLRAQPQA